MRKNGGAKMEIHKKMVETNKANDNKSLARKRQERLEEFKKSFKHIKKC